MLRRLALACLALFATNIFAQTAQTSASDHPGYSGVSEFVGGAQIPPIKNAPFSAKVLIENTRVLADGTQVTRKTMNLVARDSVGHTHNEVRRLVSNISSVEPPITRITIVDPDARTRTVVDANQRVARIFSNIHIAPPPGEAALKAPHEAATSPAPIAPGNAVLPPSTSTAAKVNDPKNTDFEKKDLGSTVEEGLELHGYLETRTLPVGFIGNDKPMVVTDEFWYSPELKVNVIVKRNDPRTGTQSVRLTEISREEPPAAMFSVPADYRRVNEPPTSSSAPGPRPGTLPGGITVPQKVSGPPPSYPESARRDRISGIVALDILVGEDGLVHDASVVRSVRADLDQQAMATVRQWTFDPARKDGQPVAVRFTVQVSFQLNEP